MTDFRDFDEETPDDKLTRKERAAWYHNGPVGSDGLTAREWVLLDNLRLQGLDIRRNFMVNVRSGVQWQHGRVVEYA